MKLNPISYNNSLFVLFFLLEIVARHPEKLDRETDTVDVLILLTTSRGWSLAAEVGQDSQSVADKDGGGGRRGHPYLQRSSCVESRTFFLFLLLPWWCGLLLW